MRIYHDWEFLEDGRTIEPISVGMIREDGEELYRVFQDAPWDRIAESDWLSTNVVPYLDATKFNVADKPTIRYDVTQFLVNAHNVDSNLELWGWYSAYDHVCLAQLFGRMIDLPDWCPMLTRDLKQEFLRAGLDEHPNIPRQSTGLHNALEDARHLRDKHLWFDNHQDAWKFNFSRGVQFGNGNVQHNTY